MPDTVHKLKLLPFTLSEVDEKASDSNKYLGEDKDYLIKILLISYAMFFCLFADKTL